MRVGVVIAVLLQVAPVAAQDEPELEARTQFEEGSRLYQEHSYEPAFEAFQRSYRLSPRPAALYNMAHMLRLLGRAPDAIALFERYLEVDTAAPASRRDEVAQTIASLRSEMVEITIDVNLPGAEISIDGNVVGVSPLTPISLSVGSHRLRVSFPRYETFNRTFDVRPGGTSRVEARLIRGAEEGQLRVTANVEQASVEVDGVDHGRVPVELDLRVGAHEVSVVAPGHVSHHESVTIEVDALRELDVRLDAAVSVTKKWWFWTILGGVIVAAAVTTLAIVLRPEPPVPVAGTLPTITALEASP